MRNVLNVKSLIQIYVKENMNYTQYKSITKKQGESLALFMELVTGLEPATC